MMLDKRLEELLWTAITHLTQDDATEEEKIAGIECLKEIEAVITAESINTIKSKTQ